MCLFCFIAQVKGCTWRTLLIRLTLRRLSQCSWKMSALCILVLAATSAAWAQTVEDRAREFLKKFDEDASRLMYQYSLASWAYNTNITAETSDKLVSAITYKRNVSLFFLWNVFILGTCVCAKLLK